jgi:diacylglycerol O-acyltransferase / wax synthase
VPGPQFPLYMAGAKVTTYFPVSIPTHSVALNITVQSYNGSLDYGLIACRRAVPDIDDLADYVVEAHAELTALAPAAQEAAPAAQPVDLASAAAARGRRSAAPKA